MLKVSYVLLLAISQLRNVQARPSYVKDCWHLQATSNKDDRQTLKPPHGGRFQ